MKKPLITVVTITFNLIKNNRVKTFKQCVESVQKQSYPHIEHLIIDGNSSDGTKEILKKYEKKGWIRFISESDKGVYDAMNRGILLSKGKYITFLNSDDFYHNKSNLEKNINILSKSKIDLIYTDVKVKIVDNKTENKFLLWKANINRLVFGTHFCHQGVIYSKKLLNKYTFDTNYRLSADSDQINRIVSNKENIKYSNKSFATYRSGGFSNLNPRINRIEHSNSFYTHIGKKEGLSKKDCYMLWNFSLFSELPIREALMYYKKLKNIKWQYEFLIQFVSMVECEQISLNFKNFTDLNLTNTEKKIILLVRRLKHLIIPEGSILFKVIKKIR